jgi:hypothetical protein
MAPAPAVQIFVFYSPILVSMAFGFPSVARRQFAVTCKLCRRDVPAGVDSFPFQSLISSCPLCGEQRRYLPSEVFLGKPDGLVARQSKGRQSVRS